MKNYIKYPIAFNKETLKLVNILDATDDNKSQLICLECKESFVAVLLHKTPHFKHKSTSKCKGNFESYIHWLTKEIFKTINSIELPKIIKDDLTISQKELLENQVNGLVEKKVPENLYIKFKKNLKVNLSEKGFFKIEQIETEKEFKTPLGNVRIDIVTKINNQNLFIEPFFTNPINDLKKRKLNYLNTPAISINLARFINTNNYNYTIDELRNYLVSDLSKKWIFIKPMKIEKLVSKYLKYVINEIEIKQNEFKLNNLKLKEISELENEVIQLENNIRPTLDKIWKIKNELKKIKKEIGISDDFY